MRALPSFPSLPSGQILVADTLVRLAKAHALLRDSPVLGFDTESRPVFEASGKASGPHLVQLATDDAVVLFPISRTVPASLRKPLECERVRNVGFGLGSDRQRLAATFGIRLRGDRS